MGTVFLYMLSKINRFTTLNFCWILFQPQSRNFLSQYKSVLFNNTLTLVTFEVISFHLTYEVDKSHIGSVRWGVPVREDTCPGPSAL